jgi:hypothetical protein
MVKLRVKVGPKGLMLKILHDRESGCFSQGNELVITGVFRKIWSGSS